MIAFGILAFVMWIPIALVYWLRARGEEWLYAIGAATVMSAVLFACGWWTFLILG
jgi:hypothetical protein